MVLLRTSLVLTVACTLLTGAMSITHGLDLLGSFVGGSTYDVVSRGNLAYLALSSGMAIIDVSDASRPVRTAFLNVGQVYAIDLTGRYALLAHKDNCLMVVDVIEPYAPRVLGQADVRGAGVDVRASGDYAYVLEGEHMRVFCISDPADPVEVTKYELVDYGRSIDISGNYAYVAADASGLRIIDISDPQVPCEVGHFSVPNRTLGACVSGKYAYVTDEAMGLIVADVTDPENPTKISHEVVSGWVIDVSVSGEYAYLSAFDWGFAIVDVSDPENPVEVSSRNTEGATIGIHAVGDHAYVADGVAGLRIIDVANPADPSEVGYYRAPHTARSVEVSGNYAYVAEQDRTYGMSIIDISDPDNLFRLTCMSTPGVATSVRVVGNLAYVTDCGQGLRIVDISDPADPVTMGHMNTEGCARDVVVEGGVAYIPEYHRFYTDLDGPGLRVVDIQDPSEPKQIWSGIMSQTVMNADLSGNYLYVADLKYGLRIMDVRDPSAPSEVSQILTEAGARDVAVSGGYVYLGTDDDLQIIDVSDPLEPAVVGRLPAARGVTDVLILDEYAYIGDEPGLRVIEISDATAPVEIDRFELPGGLAYDICAVGRNVYAVDMHAGLWVLRFLPPYYLTGHVLDLAGVGIDGITVSLAGSAAATATTDSEGYYEFVRLEPGDYTVRPVRTGWTFEPDRLILTDLSGNHRNQDFSGSPAVETGSFRVVGGSEGYIRPEAGEVATIIINPVDSGNIAVSVLTVRGQRIWSESEHIAADKETRIEWNCRNANGEVVASGIYLVRLNGAGFNATEKVAVVK